jgi:hypothetical protein
MLTVVHLLKLSDIILSNFVKVIIIESKLEKNLKREKYKLNIWKRLKLVIPFCGC